MQFVANVGSREGCVPLQVPVSQRMSVSAAPGAPLRKIVRAK